MAVFRNKTRSGRHSLAVISFAILSQFSLILLLLSQPHETIAFHASNNHLPSPVTSNRGRIISSPLLLESRTPALASALHMMPLSSVVEEASTLIAATSTMLTTTMTLADAATAATTATGVNPSELLKNTNFLVFVAGIFPFMWATVEFWRRIMFGESFGTGTDSVIIGMDDMPEDSRGQKILGKGALITAYVIFVLAFGTLGIVGYSVITSAPPSPEDFAAMAAASAASAAVSAVEGASDVVSSI